MAGTTKSNDVVVVVSLMAVLLGGMIALVLIVGRSDDHKPPPAPMSSVEAAIASASPSHPVVLIVDPASTDPPIVASEIPAPPVTNTPDPPPRPTAVPKMGLGDDQSNYPLNTSDINKVIDSHREELHAECYSKITNIKSSAKVVIHIGRSGNVSGVDLVQSSGPPEVAKCVVEKAKTWVFPASADEANVQMPFFFR